MKDTYEEIKGYIPNIETVKRYKNGEHFSWILTVFEGYVIYNKNLGDRFNEDGTPKTDFTYARNIIVPASWGDISKIFEAIPCEEWMNVIN